MILFVRQKELYTCLVLEKHFHFFNMQTGTKEVIKLFKIFYKHISFSELYPYFVPVSLALYLLGNSK